MSQTSSPLHTSTPPTSTPAHYGSDNDLDLDIEPIPFNLAPTPSPPPRENPVRPASPTSAQRVSRIPARFEDVLPPIPFPGEPLTRRVRRVILLVRESLVTQANRFGLFREYHYRPTSDPDSLLNPEDLANFSTQPSSTATQASSTHIRPPPWPFNNMTTYRVMEWMNTGSNQKSEKEVDRFVEDVIQAEDFKKEDLAAFSAHRLNRVLDKSQDTNSAGSPFDKDGWSEVSVDIEIPSGQWTAFFTSYLLNRTPTGKKNHPAKTFTVPGLHRRSLVAVIKAAFQENLASRFHLTPFKRFKKTVDGDDIRVYDEVYTADAWIDAHEELQRSPREPGCKLERVIAGLMFWSDSTHLANFGTAKVWPLYLYFANLSKYIRAKPSSGACHHVAYFPSVNTYISWEQVGYTIH